MADCAPGFAHGTTGGKDGEFYVVTDPIHNGTGPKPGALRHAVTQTGPLWITFKGSMTIKLQQKLIVTKAHITEYDEYSKARELEDIENLAKAYHSNPEEVDRHYNDHLSRNMIEFYITKRVLAESKKGPCEVTNHVDSFGGKGGEFYAVTDPIDNAADPKPGTLRHAITQNGPPWITVKRSMTIKLEQELIVTSDKTIDARGANVEIYNGAGITVQFAKNVIIYGLQIHHIIPAKGGKTKDGENYHGLPGASDG
ncbi:hypothetical protein Goklo_023991, partial [Gossypium klotzschianum]|nr:hypothetical protein [Gossypium klotzschianum]